MCNLPSVIKPSRWKPMRCCAMFFCLWILVMDERNERQHLAWLIIPNIHVTFLKPHKEFCFIWIQVELICRRTMEAKKRFSSNNYREISLFFLSRLCVSAASIWHFLLRKRSFLRECWLKNVNLVCVGIFRKIITC